MEHTPSRFIQKTLLPDERCIKDARFSRIYEIQALVLLGFCGALGYAVHIGLYRYFGQYILWPVWAGGGVGLFLFLSMMMKKWTTEIILTNERLIYKRGFFMVDVVEVDIEQLASDIVEQSLLGRLFNYGEIHIRCIEATDIWLPPIRHPYEFRNALEQQKHHYRESYMKVERLRRRGGDAKED